MAQNLTLLEPVRAHLPTLHSVLEDDPRRPALEAFVRAVFQRSYGAEITHFSPELLGDLDAEGRLHAVLGLRPAETGPLYCETYLDRPVEQLIAGVAGHPVNRSDVVEVAHLAPESAGQARALTAALTLHLHARGVRWVAFTTVPRLRNAFRRMGLAPIPLAAADPSRLPPGELARWGSYYAGHPVVYAGDVAASRATLQHIGTAASAA